MGKKRTVTVDGATVDTKKKTIFKWEEAYQELSPKAASSLKEARIKPDQLAAMADGELLSIVGINQAILEEIRAVYPAGLVTEVTSDKKEAEKREHKVEKSAKKTAEKESQADSEAKDSGAHPRLKFPRHLHGRSSRYKDKVSKSDSKLHSAASAVELLRKISYSKHKTIELHLNALETGLRGETTLPFSIGKEVKVAVFSPDLADQIKAGKIDFDILLATPADMPKIAPLARILGPRGVMPSPKNNTIVADPAKRARELQSGATIAYKTEVKAPVIHLVIGSLNQKDDEIAANIKAIITAIGAGKLKGATLKSTMSPAVKLDLASL